MNPFAAIGRGVLSILAETGRFSAFAFRAIAACFSPPVFLNQLWRQCLQVGYFSLPVIGLTAVFIGAALALNIYTGGSRFNAEQFVPQIVVLGIVRELGPVLAGLMLSGRVSAGIAAEIGTMRVTEQIDAMSTLSTDPFRFLVAPRVLAAVICVPVLVAIADIIGVMGGYLVSVYEPRFQRHDLFAQHVRFYAAERRGSRPHQSRRLRLHHRGDGRLSGLQFQRRRAWRWPRHHQRGGRLHRDDPRHQLRDHGGVCRMSDTPKLQLVGLKKNLRGRQVLDGVDLDVAPGRSLVIIGGSGQGKSVTIKCAQRIMKPDAGKVLVDGDDVICIRAGKTAMRRSANSACCSRARPCSTA